MAKKKFDFDNPLLAAEEPKAEPKQAPQAEAKKKRGGRPRKEGVIRVEEGGTAAQNGLSPEYTRYSVICKVSNVKDLKDYAYTKRLNMKDATDEILETFFKAYRKNKKNEPLLDHTGGKK